MNDQETEQLELKIGRGSAVKIAPSLLAADFSDLKTCLQAVRAARVKWIHLDIMDGHFVPNLTFGPVVVSSIRPVIPQLRFDVHLMVENPEMYFEPFSKAGADAITFHVEAANGEEVRLISELRKLGIGVGISVKPDTPADAVEHCLDLVDLVLVMTVEPGFGGQKLIPHTLSKLRELVRRRERKNRSFLLQVDGGIDRETAPLAVAAGADVLVAGTAVFKNNQVADNIAALRKTILSMK